MFSFQRIFSDLRADRKNQLIVIMLICAAGLGAFLRLYKLEERYLWFGDSARDLLVSKHIWQYGEEISIGHYASGLHTSPEACQVRNYPSYYYNVLALLWAIGRNVSGISVLLALINSLAIIFVYLIVSQLVNRWAGVVGAFLYAITFNFILASQYATTVNLPIPFILVAVAILLTAIQKKQRWLAMIGLTGFIYLSTFHYSLLLLFGFFFVVTEWSFLVKSGLARQLGFIALRGCSYGLIFLLLHSAVIKSCGSIGSFLEMFIPAKNGQGFLEVINNALLIFQSQLGALLRIWPWFCLMGVLLTGGYAALYSLKARHQLTLIGSLIIFFTVGGALLPSSSLEMLIIQTSYLKLIFFFFIAVAVGHALTISWQRKSYLIFTAIGAEVVVLIFSLSVSLAVLTSFTYPASLIDLARFLTQRPEVTSAVVTVQKEAEGDYETAVLAFWLEELTEKQWYRIVDGSPANRVNYQPIDLNPNYQLFICDTQSNWQDVDCVGSLQRFKDQHQLYIVKEPTLTYKQYIITILEKQENK